MKKEEKGIIAEGIYVPYFEKHLGGRNSNPNDALAQLGQNEALLGLRIATVTYDMKTGRFSRSAWENYKRDALPKMVRYDYYLLHEGMPVEEAMKGVPRHYFWDVFWLVAAEEESDAVGIVVQKVEISPAGEELCKDEPFVLKAFGQPCNEGEVPMPSGLQSARTK